MTGDRIVKFCAHVGLTISLVMTNCPPDRHGQLWAKLHDVSIVSDK